MEISDVLVGILTKSKFAVNKYESSDGSITDMVCRRAGREGYLRLVKESLEALDSVVAEYAKTEEGSAVDPVVLADVRGKIAASLAKKLEESDAPPRSSKEDAVAVTPDILMIDGDPAKIALLRLEVIEEVRLRGPDKTPKSKPETLLRNAIESKLPVSRYRHRINIYPGKCQSVSEFPL